MLKVRKAQKDDARFIYDLRFSVEVIAASLSPAKPTFEEHFEWFTRKVNSQDVVLLIGENSEGRMGFLRYDCREEIAEISIALIKAVRGKGFGQELLALGENWLLENTKLRTLIAKVLPANPASLQMFKAQAFTEKFIELEKVLR